MTETEMKMRTKSFALRVMRLVGSLPKNTVGKTIGSQLARSGTSVGANYRSACRGRSKAEFVAKLGVAVEEADESGYWLELIIEGKLLLPKLVEPLLNEASELAAILTSSHKTALRHLKATSPPPPQAHDTDL